MARIPVLPTMRHAGLAISAFALAALGQTAGAQELSLRVKGSIDAFHTSASLKSATDLVPSPAGAGYRDAYRGVATTLNISGQSGAFRFGTQVRFDVDGETDAEVHLDEAFGEVMLGEHVFAFAGRRILTWGQSFGLNPADILHDPLRENAVFRQSNARTKVEGADMAGADILFNTGHALTLLYAPDVELRDNGAKQDLALARFSGFAFDGALEYAVSAIGGDRPGLGLSLNQAIGDASVVYLDGTFRKGRDKRTIASVSAAGALRLDAPDDDTVHPYVTLGVGHTFGSGWSANLEYTHDAGGYSKGEWRQIMQALEQVTPVRSAIQGQSFGQINGLLDHYTLRRNYVFGRLAHDALLDGKIATEVTVLHGLDDGSGSLGLRLEYPVAEQVTLGLKATHTYGGETAEFTLRPETDTIAIYTSIEF